MPEYADQTRKRTEWSTLDENKRMAVPAVMRGARCDKAASFAWKSAELTAPTWRAQANEGAAP